jgi:hypothetical protein
MRRHLFSVAHKRPQQRVKKPLILFHALSASLAMVLVRSLQLFHLFLSVRSLPLAKLSLHSRQRFPTVPLASRDFSLARRSVFSESVDDFVHRRAFQARVLFFSL